MKILWIILAAFLCVTNGAPSAPEEPTDEQVEEPIKDEVIERNLEEIGGNFEGDMVLSPEALNQLSSGSKIGLIDTRYRWPNNRVPYVIDSRFSAAQRSLITSALNGVQSATGNCLRIYPRTTERDFVYIKGDSSGCWSNVGYGFGARTLNLQMNGCVYYGIIQHEFLHAIGIFHMQSATDRDKFVRIQYQNISPGTEHNFQIQSGISNFGVPYDYGSIMHYDRTAFSRNGQPTIVPLQNAAIGQRNGLSALDVRRIKNMHNCP